jgi:spore coat protein U-like protein
MLAATASVACSVAQAFDCTVFTAGVAFGVYDAAIPSPTDATGSITLRCTHEGGGATRTTYTIGLSAGNSGNFAQRQLFAGPRVLNYNLFTSATRTQVWGDGTQGTGIVSGALVVNPGRFVVNEAVYPIYGRIPPLQAADTGSYSDTILVTLTF